MCNEKSEKEGKKKANVNKSVYICFGLTLSSFGPVDFE
jgi:hypothetical protein